jgi:RND superfamily putative drug exporter
MLSELVFVKELGLGVAFAVIIDATLVRGVLVPAVMKLLGAHAWWSPFQDSAQSSGFPTPRSTDVAAPPTPAPALHHVGA